jgi:hypothetical protein
MPFSWIAIARAAIDVCSPQRRERVGPALPTSALTERSPARQAPNGAFFTILRIAACCADRQEKVWEIVVK